MRDGERERARQSVLDAYGSDGERPPARRKRVDLARLGATFEEALPVRALLADTQPDELARWLYLLVGVHSPCLWELREERTHHRPARARETYVRVGVSSIGSYATLQECVLDFVDDGRAAVLREQPELGVVDTRLRKVVTCAQGVTRKAGLVLLDIAFLVEPAPVPLLENEALRARVHGAPTMWSLLFDPAPPTTTRETAMGSTSRTHESPIAVP